MGISLGHNAWTLPAVNARSTAEGKLPANERMLQDALRRAVNARAGITMLVLHAAQLPGAATRPHRSKLARAVLDDIAEQVDGEVFRLTNGDLVLMARRPGAKLGAAGLGGTLGRLFDHPAADCTGYISCWPLDQSAADATAYVASRLADAADQPPILASLPLAVSDWPGDLLSGAPLWNLLSRQTAVRLTEAAEQTTAVHSTAAQKIGALVTLHHAVAFSPGMLQARAPMPASDIDRCMARHLCGTLEPALLAQLTANIRQPAGGRAASFAGLTQTAPVFVSLGLRALASAEFAALLQAGRAAGQRPGGWLGVELPWIEIVSDAGRFARARALLVEHGVPWALTGLSHGGLLLGMPQRLGPDLLKLDWSPSLGNDGDRRRDSDAALAAIGPARIILAGADCEAAVRWGVARGIRRFQGSHVEAMLAAGRMVGCPQARHCTITQCSQRGTAIAASGRAGCLRLDLLDGHQSEPSERSA